LNININPNWTDTMLEWYENSDREIKAPTLEEINEEWRAAFMTEEFIGEEMKDMNTDRSQIIENWAEILLEWYEDSDREVKAPTLEEINEDWCGCFMTDLKSGERKDTNIDRSQINENWTEILLDWYQDSDREVKAPTLEEINEEWRECFMTDLKADKALRKAA